MGVKGYFIQYKFIIPENMKHSSYTYQKLFRALYGYTQAVFKSNGKTYHYHRAGVLSATPYLRPGKNCVIIPPGKFQHLLDFFKTGRKEKLFSELNILASKQGDLDNGYLAMVLNEAHSITTDEWFKAVYKQSD